MAAARIIPEDDGSAHTNAQQIHVHATNLEAVEPLPASSRVYLNFPPNSVLPVVLNESDVIAKTLFGRDTANALIRFRNNSITSTLAYLSTTVLLFLGCILFTLTAFKFSKSIWQTVLRWLFTCCIPFTFIQLLFGSLRLMTDVVRLLVVRFHVWYLIFQTSLFFWGCVSLTLETDWKCVIWSLAIVWSATNIVLIDAMGNSSRLRMGTTGIIIGIIVSIYATCVAITSSFSQQSVYFFASPLFEQLGRKPYFIWPSIVIGDATATFNLYYFRFLWIFVFRPSEAVHLDADLVRSQIPNANDVFAPVRGPLTVLVRSPSTAVVLHVLPPVPTATDVPTVTELVPEFFPPMLIDEKLTVARVYFGTRFAEFLESVRSIRWLSPLLYIFSITFMMLGGVLCFIESIGPSPKLVRILSVSMYCTGGFALWQTFQSSMRLVHPLLGVLVQSFNVWYTILQAVSAVVAFAVVLALSNDFLLLCWFTLVVWTGINMHLVDAMTEKSRVRLGSSGLIITIVLATFVGIVCLLCHNTVWEVSLVLPGEVMLREWFNRGPIEIQPLLFVSTRVFTYAIFASRLLFKYWQNANGALNLCVPRVRHVVA